jgi:phosphatidylinositol glycan class A protein
MSFINHVFACDPWTVTALLLGLETALANLRSGNVVPPWDCHHRVASLYNWMDVAHRTEAVYHRVAGEKNKTLGSQLRSYMASGVLPFLLIISLAHLMLRFLDWMVPQRVSIIFITAVDSRSRHSTQLHKTAINPIYHFIFIH